MKARVKPDMRLELVIHSDPVGRSRAYEGWISRSTSHLISALTFLVVGLLFGCHWDAAKNRGHTWGYWGEFNTVSNALNTIPGVTILTPWCHTDVSLEEFGFNILVHGRQVELAFSETNPTRSLSGRKLRNALSELIEKKSSSQTFATPPEAQHPVSDGSAP